MSFCLSAGQLSDCSFANMSTIQRVAGQARKTFLAINSPAFKGHLENLKSMASIIISKYDCLTFFNYDAAKIRLFWPCCERFGVLSDGNAHHQKWEKQHCSILKWIEYFFIKGGVWFIIFDSWITGPGGGGYSTAVWVGGCRPDLETLTLFMIKSL